MEVEDVALYLSDFLLHHYPQLLLERYALGVLPATDMELLELVGAKRGCLRGGGHVDLEKVSSILVNEFRTGVLGRMTLETPEMVMEEERLVTQQKKEKAERDALQQRRSPGSHTKPVIEG